MIRCAEGRAGGGRGPQRGCSACREHARAQIANLLLPPIEVQEQVLAPGYQGSERGLRAAHEPAAPEETA